MKIITPIVSLQIRVTVAFMLVFHSFYAQYFEFNWSDEIRYANSKNGFFDGYINTNSSYMYVLNSNYAVSPINQYDKVKLVAYNKSTMMEASSVALKGFPENKSNKEEYESLRYHKTVVLDSKIIVFWTKLINSDSNKTEEVYAESFKTDLERETTLKKVYSFTQRVDVQQSDFSASSIVILSNLETDRLIIGSELHQPDSNIVFRFTHLNINLAASGENKIELPSKCKEVQNGLVSAYDWARDGNLYIRSVVTLSKEEQRVLKPVDPKNYLVLTVLNPVSMDEMHIEMRGENKTITDFSYIVTDTTAKIVGFFGDLSKDLTGIDKQGIFYADINSDDLKNIPLNYAYFEKTTLNRLFPKSRGGRKKSDTPSLDEQLHTRFDIEYIFPMEDRSVVLFFTRKYNYSEITSRSGMDGRNIYKTDNYCEKNNVSAIRFTEEGKISWTSSIERTITYNGTDIADLRIINRSNKFYTMYGTEPTKKVSSGKKRKGKLDLRDNLEYTTFDAVSGKAKKIELEVVNESDKDRKYIDPNSIRVYDNKFYFSKMIVKQKVLWYAANVLFFPSIYYSILSGNTKSAKGDLGVIVLMDGKPDKKKR